MLKKIITAALQPLDSLPKLVKSDSKKKEKKENKEPTNEKPN